MLLNIEIQSDLTTGHV